jgi:hypothetical protein
VNNSLSVTQNAIEAEKRGVPSVSLVYPNMVNAVYIATELRGMPALRTLVVPRPREGKTGRGELPPGVLDNIVKALTSPLTGEEKKTGIHTPKPIPRIAMTGTFDEVQDFFIGDLSRFELKAPRSEWTDALPIIPPTEERVAEMLTGTSHAPEEVIGRMLPERREFTVEKVAINGVMAGCKPEYMPILLAMSEILANMGDMISIGIASTTSFGYMSVVSGPIAKEISMNSGENILNPGYPPNATIGRAMRLMLMNLGGSRSGSTFIENYGNPCNYSCCFAEDVEHSPWEPLGTDYGFKRRENTLSVYCGMKEINTMFISGPGYRATKQFLPWVPRAIKGMSSPTSLTILIQAKMAQDLVEQGFTTKQAVKQWIWENTTETFKELKSRPWYELFQFRAREDRARILEAWPPEILQLPDDGIVHLPPSPDLISIVVAGGEGEGSTLIKNNVPQTTGIDKWR